MENNNFGENNYGGSNVDTSSFGNNQYGYGSQNQYNQEGYNQNNQQYYQNNNYQSQQYQQSYQGNIPQPTDKAQAYFISGIIQIVLSVCCCGGGFLGLVCGIVSLITANAAKTAALTNNMAEYEKNIHIAKIATIVGYIAMILAIIVTILMYIFGFFGALLDY